jgi:hypothetical protein
MSKLMIRTFPGHTALSRSGATGFSYTICVLRTVPICAILAFRWFDCKRCQLFGSERHSYN